MNASVIRHLSGGPSQEDLHVAIRDAFDAARRRLRDHGRRLDGEIYFHRHSVKGRGFDSLKPGDRVRHVIDPQPGEHGAHASAVFPLGPNAD
jgi:cold shock CspA family protein